MICGSHLTNVQRNTDSDVSTSSISLQRNTKQGHLILKRLNEFTSYLRTKHVLRVSITFKIKKLRREGKPFQTSPQNHHACIQPVRLGAAGWLGWPALSHEHVHVSQPAVLLSHINEPATIRTSQPNRLMVLRLNRAASGRVLLLNRLDASCPV